MQDAKKTRKQLIEELMELRQRVAESETSAIKSKQTKELLGESVGHYRMYFNNSPDGLFVVDLKGQYLEVNDAACRMTGYSMEKLTNMSISDLIVPEQLEQGLKDFEKLLNTGCLSTELLLRRKDDTKFFIRLDAVKISDDRCIGFAKDITERKQAEKALESEKKRVFTILDLIPGFVYLQAPDYTIPFANRRFIKQYGDPKGGRCHEIIWDRKEPCDKCPTFNVFKTNKPDMWVSDHVSTGCVYQVYDYPFIDSDGSLLVLEMSVDITDQKRIEEKLERSRDYLENLHDSIGDPVFSVKLPERVIDHINSSVEAVFGYKPEECTGKSTEMFYPEKKDYLAFGRKIKRALEQNEGVLHAEQVLKRKKGEVFSAEITTTFLRENGKPSRVISIVRDITERKQAEDSLRESEKMLKEAQKIALLGHWELDLISNKLFWSDEIYKIFNMDPNKIDASYEAFLARVHPDEREFVDNAYKSSVMNKTTYDIVHRLLMQDGTIKFVNEKCITNYDEDGNPLRSLGTVQDITERKLAEETLLQKTEKLNSTNKELNKLALEMKRVEEKERKRFAEVLHENIGQNLVAIKIAYESGENISEIPLLINETIKATRFVTTDLYPVILDKLGFIEGINWYISSLLEPKKIKVSLDIDKIIEVLDEDLKRDIFRIVRECFQSLIKIAIQNGIIKSL